MVSHLEHRNNHTTSELTKNVNYYQLTYEFKELEGASTAEIL